MFLNIFLDILVSFAVARFCYFSDFVIMEGAASCFSESSVNRGCWSADEDMVLKKYVETHGAGRWNTVAVKAGLRRSGKSCRLRWMNYLRPNVKLGHISADEEELIIRLHKLLGNRWSLIAGRVPGRTDNEVKNYWNIHLSKKLETRSKIPTRRRHFKGSRPLDMSTGPEDPMTINSTDSNGNLNSRSADAAATNAPQLKSPRDSNLAPVDSREKNYSGPDFLNFRPCSTSVMSGLREPSPLLTDEFVSAKLLRPVYGDQGVSTSAFENLSVGWPCSDLIHSSPFYSWVDILPNWINCSVEIEDQWFPGPANEHIWPLNGEHGI